jgi:tRNA (guanosine-2'-O-)-methyltransferase
MYSEIDKDLIEYLKEFVSDERFTLFQRILNSRTRYMTVVLEDIFQAQNASAVLRSCDCFGVQDVHIIENKYEFQVDSEVDMGSSKWLNIHNYKLSENNTHATIQKLKNAGYRIIATTPHRQDITPEFFDIEKGKFALMFGTEKTGLSQSAIENADEYLKIPMLGFTESLNISVSAAILLHYFSLKLINSTVSWQLSDNEKEKILHQWLLNSIREGKKIEDNYIKKLKGIN